MSEDDVYICLVCYYPIIFRYKPPQVFHLGTAWVCWRKQHEGDEPVSDDEEDDSVRKVVKCQIPQTTPDDLRQGLLEKMKRRYRVFCRTGDAAPLLDLVMTLLEGNRADVVGGFFRYLAFEGSRSSRAMVYIIVSLRDWEEYVVNLRDRVKGQYREQLQAERRRLAGLDARR